MVHFVILICYFLSEIASLTLVLISYFSDHMSAESSTLWFGNSLLWCIDGTVNFIAMLFVLDRINQHYQEVKKEQKKVAVPVVVHEEEIQLKGEAKIHTVNGSITQNIANSSFHE